MQIPNKAVIAVADGAKLLLFRNEGDEAHLDMQVAHHNARETRPDRELGTDAPGRTFSSVGDGRSAYDETDFHQQNEDRFAHDAVDLLNSLALEGWYQDLVIVAAPKTLGEMRPKYHKELASRLRAKLPKDLAHMPTPEIEKALEAHEG